VWQVRLRTAVSVYFTLLLGCDEDQPKNVPMKNVESGTLMTGETMLMNQLGRNGVMRRNTM